eukprot:3702362-Alexandrium_andersonii.AAC.1
MCIRDSSCSGARWPARFLPAAFGALTSHFLRVTTGPVPRAGAALRCPAARVPVMPPVFRG